MKTKKKMKTKMFLGVLLSLALVLGLLPALLPGMNLTAYADAQPTYKIQVKDIKYNDTRTLAANGTLPYQTTGSALLKKQGYGGTVVKVVLRSGNNITVTGTDISINGSGTSNIRIYSSANAYVNFQIIVTKNITTTATGYDGIYDGQDHSISVDVSIPTSGATVKYGTANGTYNLTESPRYTDVGTYTVYYQVTANDYNTRTGSAKVKIGKATPSVTALPSASAITYGKTLADSTLSGGAASHGSLQVPGTFTWKTPSAAPTVNDSNSTAFPVVFTPDDTTNYNTAECAVKLTVNPIDPDIPTGLTANYGQTLADVELPAGWAWADSSESVGNAGTNTFKANYTPTSNNYNAKSNVDVEVTVSPIDPEIPTGLTANYGQTLADVELPAGWAWADSSESVGNAGTNTFKANYTPTSNNYNAKSNVDVEVTVSPIDPDIPTGLTAFDGQTLDAVTLPEGWAWDDPATNVGTPGTKSFPASYTKINNNYNNMNTDLEVVVNAVSATGVTVVPNALNVFVSETKALTATVTPNNASNQNVTWSSSNDAVAAVDQDGKVTGVGAGETTITATAEDGGFTAECAVIVKDVTFVATINGQSSGSKGLFFKFELETPIDGFNYMKHFVKASVFDKDNNETALVDGQNCAIAKGSLDITLYKAFLNELKGKNPGTYTLVVTFDIGTATATFIVPPPTSADTSPASGESMVLVISAIALMLFAACGGVYAVSRRKAIGE